MRLYRQNKPMWRILFVLIAVVLARPDLAAGVCLEPNPPRVCTEFFTSQLVFVGTVISDRYLAEGLPDRDPGWVYDLSVTKMYRGPQRARLQVYTEDNSARFPLEVGHSYLLFASETTGMPEIYGCGNSAEVDSATPSVIAEIQKTLNAMRPGAGGDISGRITELYGYGPESMEGIAVSAENGQRTYRAISSSDGSFRIHVPAGRYRVKAASPSLHIFPYDLTYYNPGYVPIEDGGCAEVVFNAFPLKPR
jgi:hypothetical protein